LIGIEAGVAEDFRKADDGVERGANFVADIGEEIAFGAIGAFGVGNGLLLKELAEFSLGDVAHDAGEEFLATDAGAVEGDFDGDAGSVGAQGGGFDRLPAFLPADADELAHLPAGAELRRDEAPSGGADQIFELILEDPAGGLAGEDDLALDIEGEDGVGGGLHDDAKAFFAFAEGLIGAPSLGDIAVAPDPALDAAVHALRLGVALVDAPVEAVDDVKAMLFGMQLKPLDALRKAG